jgi:uncharacterized protein (UPF0212 family)
MQVVTYTCPECGQKIDIASLQRPGGTGGGMYCPHCQARVHISFAYGRIVAIVSLLLALAILRLLHVTLGLVFIIGTILVWVPLSMFLNLWTTGLRSPTIKKWKPRRRTFFEWLYDRDAPQDIFGKNPKS